MFNQSEQHFECPYCGERISVLVDHSVPHQRYIEDCEVCCRPLSIECTIDSDSVEMQATRSDD